MTAADYAAKKGFPELAQEVQGFRDALAPRKVTVEPVMVAAWPAGARVFAGGGRNLDLKTAFTTEAKTLDVVGFPEASMRVDEGLGVELIAYDRSDLALLKIEGADVSADAIGQLRKADDEPRALEPVLSLGFPGGVENIELSEAKVTPRPGHVTRVQNTIEVDIGVDPGNSGGPVFDLEGRIIGVTTRRAGASLANCIPASAINRLIMSSGATPDLPR